MRQKIFVRFRKDHLLAELQAKTSKGCRILLFQHHSYMVTLKGKCIKKGLLQRYKVLVKSFAHLNEIFFSSLPGGDR